MAGFAFAKLPSKITPVLHGTFIIEILITLQCFMIPLFILIRGVGLINKRLGVLIPYIDYDGINRQRRRQFLGGNNGIQG